MSQMGAQGSLVFREFMAIYHKEVVLMVLIVLILSIHRISYNGSISPSNESVMDSSWYADSCATSHVTPDASHVSQSSPYSGFNN
ncbi:hypothetical protein Syun_019635 [Stephania yunnanensis]|uniref:Uncharacterized protein n=1 Tax=Stephania yunnanensis TaxID=152371 RepID=A0AAP0NWV1_9MAGN